MRALYQSSLCEPVKKTPAQTAPGFIFIRLSNLSTSKQSVLETEQYQQSGSQLADRLSADSLPLHAM